MNEFEDDEIRNRLARISGPMPDTNTAYVAVQQRVGRARRKRALIGTGAVAVTALLFVGLLATISRPQRRVLTPATTAESATTEGREDPTTVPPTSIETPSTRGDDVVATSTSAPTTAAPPPVAADSTPVADGTDVATTTPAGAPASGGPTAPAHRPATTVPAPAPVPTNAPPTAPPTTPPTTTSTVERTFASNGGSVTVRLANGSLTTVAVTPAAGFTVTSRSSQPSEVDVRFESSSSRWRVTVSLVDGAMHPEVIDEGSHDGTDGSGRGSGGG